MKEITIRFKTYAELKADSDNMYGIQGHYVPVKVFIDGKEIERLKSFSISVNEDTNPLGLFYSSDQYLEFPIDDDKFNPVSGK